MTLAPASICPEEIARFSAQANEWWRPDGAFRALHEMEKIRKDYVLDLLSSQKVVDKKAKLPLRGLRVLDVGCGGGLMAEPLARMGAEVTGIDASASAIAVATAHAKESGLSITYEQCAAEEHAKGTQSYDIITAFEIVEHVANLKSFMTALSKMLRPGGVLLIATMNRTKRSFLLGVIAAEYVLGWVPAGTHDWDRFVKPSEMAALWEKLGIEPVDLTGVVYKPLSRSFQISKGNVAVNYFMAGKKVNA